MKARDRVLSSIGRRRHGCRTHSTTHAVLIYGARANINSVYEPTFSYNFSLVEETWTDSVVLHSF